MNIKTVLPQVLLKKPKYAREPIGQRARRKEGLLNSLLKCFYNNLAPCSAIRDLTLQLKFR